MLKVKKLHPDAVLPTCSRPGEDIAFDLYSLEDVILQPNVVQRLRTGVALEMEGFGFLVRDRSSMAYPKGILTCGGVIDRGYRGEMFVNAILVGKNLGDYPYEVKRGDKIAQIIPVRPETMVQVVEVEELSSSDRGAKGYGSSGR
jgi:dUTP pyrophosphatase